MAAQIFTTFHEDREYKDKMKQYYAKIVGNLWVSDDIRIRTAQQIMKAAIKNHRCKEYDEMKCNLIYLESFIRPSDWMVFLNWSYYYWALYYKDYRRDPLASYISAKLGLRKYRYYPAPAKDMLYAGMNRIIAETETAIKLQISEEEIAAVNDIFYIPDIVSI